MMKLEILCATMHQKDFSKIEEMNIQGNVVFANQTDSTGYREIEQPSGTAKMISTATRGVGINRNLALMYASGDVLLFADDDIIYNDGYEKNVLQAYEHFPDADMIIFSMDITQNGKVIRQIKNKNGRLSFFKALKYGTCVVSVRRDRVAQKNLWFSTLFGGGTKYGHGEDTLFILSAFRSGMKIYTSDYCLGRCSKDSSTCFFGYDDKYFYDQGVLYAGAFSWLAFPMALQFCIRKQKKYKRDNTFFNAISNMRKGIRHFREGRI